MCMLINDNKLKAVFIYWSQKTNPEKSLRNRPLTALKLPIYQVSIKFNFRKINSSICRTLHKNQSSSFSIRA